MSKRRETIGRTRRIGAVASALLIAVGFFGVSPEIAGLAWGQPPAETTDKSQQQELLRAKLAEIARLQAEVERLRQAIESPSEQPASDRAARGEIARDPTASGSAASAQSKTEAERLISAQVKVLAVSLSRLKKGGFDLLSLRQLLDSDTPTSLVDDQGTIVRLLELLEKQHLVQVLSQPIITTLDGQPAAVSVGQSEPRPQSLRLECTPRLTAAGAIVLELVLRCEGMSVDSETGAVVASPEPSSASFEVLTTVTTRPGQTAIVAGMAAREQDGPTTGILVLVTPDLKPPPPRSIQSQFAD